MTHEFKQGSTHYMLDFGTSLRHSLHSLVPLYLEHPCRYLPKLFWHAVADVLPAESEPGTDFLQRWIVSRVMKCSQSAHCLLAHTRVGVEKDFRQDATLHSEVTELFIHRFEQPDRQKVNAHFKGQ